MSVHVSDTMSEKEPYDDHGRVCMVHSASESIAWPPFPNSRVHTRLASSAKSRSDPDQLLDYELRVPHWYILQSD